MQDFEVLLLNQSNFNLKQHQKKHKEMFCTKCEIMFKTKQEFKRHQKKMHQVKCRFCCRSINIGKSEAETKSNLKSHMISKHPFLTQNYHKSNK